MATQSLEGLRTHTPEGCTAAESDLSREDLIGQFLGHGDRMYTKDGCPVRLDIAAMGTTPADDHCFPGVRGASIRLPLHGSIDERTTHHYVRDPDDLFHQPDVHDRLDLDSELPAAAVDSGYRQGESELWVDPTDETLIYVVSGERTEAWPLQSEPVFCA